MLRSLFKFLASFFQRRIVKTAYEVLIISTVSQRCEFVSLSLCLFHFDVVLEEAGESFNRVFIADQTSDNNKRKVSDTFLAFV